FRLLREHAVALPDAPELLDELAHVRLRESSPGVLRMDHDADRHDDQAIALALVAHSLVEDGPGQPGVGVTAAERILGDRDLVPGAPTPEIMFTDGQRVAADARAWAGPRPGRF